MKKTAVAFIGLSLLSNLANSQTTFTIDVKKKRQAIHDFGASGCWNSEEIGKFWPDAKKNRMAEWLFSAENDAGGNPKGIALSSYRFNIGAGTAEQGEASNIPSPSRRTECFLDPTGRYDFSKQAGYIWFVKKAKEYGVPTLIAFVNSPPVFMNKNGLGFKTNKDGDTNLRDDKYGEFANFLATVLNHFDSAGLPFNYISPVNEPQWEWTTNNKGKSSQEGCPYFNSEIAGVVRKIDSVFTEKHVRTKIFIDEAGAIDRLVRGNGWADDQIDNFWNPASSNYLGNLKNLQANAVSGHSYWTENTTQKLIESRQELFRKLQATNKDLQFWQTEYSFLGDGYKEGTHQKRSPIDCGLFLAKVIHHDLTLENAPVWEFWTAIDATRPDNEIRYTLISAVPDQSGKNGEFHATKNLWALGNYSRFVRPGMYRVETERNDGLSLTQAANQLMLSAYIDETDKKLVIVAINYDTTSRSIQLRFQHLSSKIPTLTPYITSADDDLKAYPEVQAIKPIALKARSVTTLIGFQK